MIGEGVVFSESYSLTGIQGQFLVERALISMDRRDLAGEWKDVVRAIALYRGLSDRHPGIKGLERLREAMERDGG